LHANQEETMKRLSIYLVAAAAVLAVAACAGVAKRSGSSDIRHKIADAYGLSAFDRVESLSYTFNVKRGNKQDQRHWTWWPKGDRVEFRPDGDADKAVRYTRADLPGAGKDIRELDAKFINDQYWLLFPLHLVWDDQAEVKEVGRRDHPIGGGRSRCVVVSYPAAGGYTPGDVYELFIDDSYRVQQWAYHRGGAPEPTITATWEDNRPVGPLTLSLDRRGPDGNFRVWFTDMAVTP
jgi:hypothetical protein